jgi:protein gp37
MTKRLQAMGTEAYQFGFQVLTKRPERLLKLSKKIKWTPNIWQGVTVEHTATRSRIEDLRLVGAHTKFLSI